MPVEIALTLTTRPPAYLYAKEHNMFDFPRTQRGKLFFHFWDHHAELSLRVGACSMANIQVLACGAKTLGILRNEKRLTESEKIQWNILMCQRMFSTHMVTAGECKGKYNNIRHRERR